VTSDGLMAFVMAYQAPVGLTASFTEAALRIATRYQDFTVRALSMGLTIDQARFILESEGLVGSITGRTGGAEGRLEHYAQYGYLDIRLGEVLTRDELAGQPFSGVTILNGHRWMDRAYAKHFAELNRGRQRGLVRAAIELTLQVDDVAAGWPLERSMAAVMPYLEET
jgi:hypothetical protein